MPTKINLQGRNLEVFIINFLLKFLHFYTSKIFKIKLTLNNQN